MRPNRSDVHLPRDEEAKIEEATRQHFDSLAPKRHTKPHRCEYSKTYTDTISVYGADVVPPEYVEFHRIENDHSEKLMYTHENLETEEFVETEYYKDLNGVDKQHHTELGSSRWIT